MYIDTYHVSLAITQTYFPQLRMYCITSTQKERGTVLDYSLMHCGEKGGRERGPHGDPFFPRAGDAILSVLQEVYRSG